MDSSQVHAEWSRDKSALVAQLVLAAEALGKHSAPARVTLFAMQRSKGPVLGDEPWAQAYDEEPLLTLVLPMLTLLPARAEPRLLSALLHLLAALVKTATGPMLSALSEILGGVHPILKLAQR